MYRISWISYPSMLTGSGLYILNLELGNAWINHLTKKHQDMRHWLENELDPPNTEQTSYGRSENTQGEKATEAKERVYLKTYKD